ncbi:membrane-associated protein, putative, partial [Bodo saltans]
AAAAGAVSLLGGIIIGALFPSVTGATLSPTAGGLPMIQGALGVLRLRRRCAAAAFDGDGTNGNSSSASEMTTQQQLSVMDSPTQLCFDTLGPQTACAAGAIAGNVALIVAVGCVIHVCAAYFRPLLRRSSMVVVTSPSSGVPAGGNTATPSSWLSVLRACLHRHLPDDRLPGSAYWTFSSLLQPTTAAAVEENGPPASKSSTFFFIRLLDVFFVAATNRRRRCPPLRPSCIEVVDAHWSVWCNCYHRVDGLDDLDCVSRNSRFSLIVNTKISFCGNPTTPSSSSWRKR